MRLDFSAFEDTLATLRERFETYCDIKLRGASRANQRLLPDDVSRAASKPRH